MQMFAQVGNDNGKIAITTKKVITKLIVVKTPQRMVDEDEIVFVVIFIGCLFYFLMFVFALSLKNYR